MAESNANEGTNDGRPELVDVVINGETITTTPAHGEQLKTMWAGIQSGANEKFEEAKKEREEAKRISDLMAEDAAWFNTHDPSLYGQYEMKASGGRGFLGDEAHVNPAMSGDNYNPDAEVKTNAEMEALKVQVKELTDIVQAGQKVSNDSALEGAVIARDELTKDAGIRLGSPADKMVTQQMENFYYTNKRHPRKHEIKPFVDTVAELMGRKVKTPPAVKKTPSTSATPAVAVNTPPGEAAPELDLSGPNGLERFIADAKAYTAKG